jgi:hypothetical protein
MKKIVKIPKDAELPLIGLIQIGIIDRGTNLLQLRTTTLCNLNCIFCSTDAGNFSKYHVTEYMVNLNYFLDWLRELIKFKGKIHAFIDSVGEPLTYPNFIDLVSEISQLKGIETIAFETNGVLLNEKMIDELSEIGLDRINLSIHSLSDKIGKNLANCEAYNISRLTEIIKYIVKSPIDLTLTPVWIPGLNDREILKIIEFAKVTIKNKRFPILGIQKYEAHKFGRKPKGIKPISWWKFFRKLEDLEKKFKIKLRLSPKDFGVKRTNILPILFRKGEKVKVKIKAPGWLRNEMIGVAKERSISIVNCNASIGKTLKVRILRNKHNIYVAR